MSRVFHYVCTCGQACAWPLTRPPQLLVEPLSLHLPGGNLRRSRQHGLLNGFYLLNISPGSSSGKMSQLEQKAKKTITRVPLMRQYPWSVSQISQNWPIKDIFLTNTRNKIVYFGNKISLQQNFLYFSLQSVSIDLNSLFKI